MAYRFLPVTHSIKNWREVKAGTRPDSIFFGSELQGFLDCSQEWLKETALEYAASSSAWRYLSGYRSPNRSRDGFCKTFDVAEGFAAWALVKFLRPRVLVELGTQYGASSSLWKEALRRYVPNHELILCDLKDERRFIRDEECTFFQGDARRILPEIFSSRKVDLLFNDAHPYDLIRWSVQEGLKQGVKTFVFHDVGAKHPRTGFKRESTRFKPEEKEHLSEAYERCGRWERHVMAEIFGKEILFEESLQTPSARAQIFDSLYGLGAVVRV